MIFDSITDKVGNTPLIKINARGFENINLYSKLEYYNPTGSAKDRAANFIVKKLLNDRVIRKGDTLIESTSGNFGIALSVYCAKYGVNFYSVVDPNISPVNEFLIKNLSNRMIVVNEVDVNGGFLLSRINKVQELLGSIPNSYWVNQYENEDNARAYCTLGDEICNELDSIDYAFIGVSSGGTITGVSNIMKQRFPKIKIIAVDIEGSIIFGGQPKKRYIPGIGSSMKPRILKNSMIDEVVKVKEISSVYMCHELLNEHKIFCGGSSGSVYAAIKEYFKLHKQTQKVNVVAIFADRGDRYFNTVYNADWIEKLKKSEL